MLKQQMGPSNCKKNIFPQADNLSVAINFLGIAHTDSALIKLVFLVIEILINLLHKSEQTTIKCLLIT